MKIQFHPGPYLAQNALKIFRNLPQNPIFAEAYTRIHGKPMPTGGANALEFLEQLSKGRGNIAQLASEQYQQYLASTDNVPLQPGEWYKLQALKIFGIQPFTRLVYLVSPKIGESLAEQYVRSGLWVSCGGGDGGEPIPVSASLQGLTRRNSSN